MKKIAVIGCGYVGLVTGAWFAEMGNHVICVDIDDEKIDALKRGDIPFFEPGLAEMVKRGITAGRLFFTQSYDEALSDALICFLALPTPSNDDGGCNHEYVLEAAKTIAHKMQGDLIIANKSTIPVGTTREVHGIIAEILTKREKHFSFDVVSNPEFLQEGSAITNCMDPDRIILGVESDWAKDILLRLYTPYLERIQIMDIESAELCKYGANAMLALRISFMNAFSGLCEKVGGNIDAIRRAIGSDPRIGNRYLSAGIGFGGSCLPKDVSALCAIARENDYDTSFFEAILDVNESQKRRFFEKILRYFGSLQGKTLAIWGLSFKPNTDDLREAPSLDLINMCLSEGAHLRLFDPVAMPKARPLFETQTSVCFCNDEYIAATGADAIVVVTEWPEFRSVDFDKIGVLMRNRVVFDGRNLYQEKALDESGFDYVSIGKKQAHKAWIS